MQKRFKKLITEHLETQKQMLGDSLLLDTLEQVVVQSITAFRNDNKLLFCGNGGSAADAQHIAAELSGRFYKERAPLFAEALHVNGSFITAVANDYGYDEVFARMVTAVGRANDILFAISTSGNSPNILKAIDAAKNNKMIVVGMTGMTGGAMSDLCDYILKIHSDNTPRIQEGHILLGHILCELVEDKLFG